MTLTPNTTGEFLSGFVTKESSVLLIFCTSCPVSIFCTVCLTAEGNSDRFGNVGKLPRRKYTIPIANTAIIPSSVALSRSPCTI